MSDGSPATGHDGRDVLATISYISDLPETHRFHQATLAALRHATSSGTHDVRIEVVRTDEIGRLGDAVLVGPGSPYRDPTAVERVIASARERGVPLLAV